MYSNVRFELHGLQKLFATAVTAVRDQSRFLFDPSILREYVLGEVARIKQCLLENVLAIESEDAARRYIRLHQYAVVTMMDILYEQSDLRATRACSAAVSGLLSFLDQHFPQYFDSDAQAPLQHIHETRIEIAMHYCVLEKDLRHVSVLDPIPFIILDPLNRFCSMKGSQRVSFHRLQYLRYIMQHAKKVIQDGPAPDNLDRRLIDLLVYLNYNSRKSILQFREFLHALLPPELNFKTKLETLSDVLRIVKQGMVKAKTGYHAHAPTFKSRMIAHLTAELKRLQEQNQREPAETISAVADLPNVKLDLSVAQLGCLLKLMTDSGLVSTDKTSTLIRTVALNCLTKRSKKISFESLRNKFYNIEVGTQQAVQEMLTKLLRSARQMTADDERL